MKLPKVTPFLFALASMPIYAAPFVVSDPYPSSGPQPTEFVITVSGQSAPVIVPATSTAQGVMLKWDVAGISGSKTITAKARNAWGESAVSSPFTFTAGMPAAPSGIGLSVK